MKKKIICYECGKLGYIKIDCPSLLKHKVKQLS